MKYRGAHPEWAKLAEQRVRDALAASAPNIARVLKRSPEAVLSSETDRFIETGWDIRPSWNKVIVFTEYGIGDPFEYEAVYEAFNRAAVLLTEQDHRAGAVDHEWHWESYRSGVAYFFMEELAPKSWTHGHRPHMNPTKRARAAGDPDKRVRLQEVKAVVIKSPTVPMTIGSPEDVVNAARHLIGNRASEVFFVLFLDIRNKAVGYITYTEGSTISVGVHPVGIFREALLVNGAGFVTAHQHPSGDPDPSAEDHALWNRLREAGKLMGIPCVDNLVLGQRTWFSESEGFAKPYPVKP